MMALHVKSLRLKPTPEAVRLAPVRQDGDERETHSRSHLRQTGSRQRSRHCASTSTSSSSSTAIKLTPLRYVRNIVVPSMFPSAEHETNARKREKNKPGCRYSTKLWASAAKATIVGAPRKISAGIPPYSPGRVFGL